MLRQTGPVSFKFLTHLLEMEKILVCRICLSESVLPNAVSIGLQKVYEKITLHQFNTEDQRPQALCSVCLVRLQKANSLMLDCLEAECLFQQIINQGNTDNVFIKAKPSKLSIKSVNVITIDSSDYKKLETENSDRNTQETNNITANYNVLNEQENTTEQLKRTVSDINNENINIDTGYTTKNNSNNSSQATKQNINIKQEIATELEEITTENNVYIKQEILDPEVLRIEKQIKKEKEISTLDDQVEQENTSENEYAALRDTYDAALNRSNSVDGMSNWPVVSNHMVGFSSVYPGSVSNIPYLQITPLQSTQSTQKKTKSHQYQCDICHKIFSIRGNLIKHIRIHTGERRFKCDVCAKMFLQRSHLENHKRIHTNERPFKCPFCDKAFVQKGSLKNHIARHVNKIHKCDMCEETFTGRRQLTRHKLVHVGQTTRPYRCEFCPRTFSHHTRLQNHILTHTSVTKCVKCHQKIASHDIGNHKCKEDNIHQCKICQKILSDKKNLRRHVQAHYGENPFKCDICQKSFSQRGNLDRHIRTHTGERPYKCDLCPSSFNQQIHLEGHMRIHTGERPYMCDVCEKTFKDRSSLRAHERVHTKQYRHQCAVCLKRFSRAEGLQNHVRKTHSGEIVTGDVAQNVIEIEVDRLTPPAREGPVDLNSAVVQIKEECSE